MIVLVLHNKKDTNQSVFSVFEHTPSTHFLTQFEHVVQVRYIADGETQNLDLRQFLVGRKRRQEFAQFRKRDVERLDANAFARRVRSSVLLRCAAPSSPLLPTEGATVFFVIDSAQARAYRTATSVSRAAQFVVRRRDVILCFEMRQNPDVVAEGGEGEGLGGRDAGGGADHVGDVRRHHGKVLTSSEHDRRAFSGTTVGRSRGRVE